MGIFTKSQKTAAAGVYTDVKKNLKEKDGNIHVVMVNSYSKFANGIFCCEDKYTTQIDEILSFMQADGYEIVDIKFSTIFRDQAAVMQGYSTLIMYK